MYNRRRLGPASPFPKACSKSPQMMTMSVDYIKIALTIITTWIFYIGIKPPNPPLRRQSRIKMKGMLEQGSLFQYVHIYVIAPLVFATIAETCLILTSGGPSSSTWQIASRIFLYNSGDASKMRLGTLNTLGGLMMIMGGLIRVWSFRALGKFFTYQVGIQEDQKLVQTGPYAIVRHPAYTAILFTQPGCVLWIMAPGSWFRESGILRTWPGGVFFVVYIFLQVLALCLALQRTSQEDEILRQHFGKQWDTWAKKVPYKIMPGLY